MAEPATSAFSLADVMRTCKHLTDVECVDVQQSVSKGLCQNEFT